MIFHNLCKICRTRKGDASMRFQPMILTATALFAAPSFATGAAIIVAGAADITGKECREAITTGTELFRDDAATYFLTDYHLVRVEITPTGISCTAQFLTNEDH